MVAVALFALGLTISPQQVPPPVPPPPTPATQVAPVTEVAPAPQTVENRAATQHRRDEIGVMEGVLAAAVRLGASQIARELQASAPGPAILIGQPRARGFILDGYGVFFNVEIPTLQKSVVWSIQQLQRDQLMTGQALDVLRSTAASLQDGDARRQYQAAVKLIEQQVGPLPARSADPNIATASNLLTEPPDDPGTQYTKAVVNACLDAMLEHSKPMQLTGEEWLTVALTGAENTLASNELSESSTFVLRIKGSDLADYLAGRTTREQVRARVEVREF